MSQSSIRSEFVKLTQEMFRGRYGRNLSDEEIKVMISKVHLLAIMLMQIPKREEKANG
jgi:hypothetical protein